MSHCSTVFTSSFAIFYGRSLKIIQKKILFKEPFSKCVLNSAMFMIQHIIIIMFSITLMQLHIFCTCCMDRSIWAYKKLSQWDSNMYFRVSSSKCYFTRWLDFKNKMLHQQKQSITCTWFSLNFNQALQLVCVS